MTNTAFPILVVKRDSGQGNFPSAAFIILCHNLLSNPDQYLVPVPQSSGNAWVLKAQPSWKHCPHIISHTEGLPWENQETVPAFFASCPSGLLWVLGRVQGYTGPRCHSSALSSFPFHQYWLEAQWKGMYLSSLVKCTIFADLLQSNVPQLQVLLPDFPLWSLTNKVPEPKQTLSQAGSFKMPGHETHAEDTGVPAVSLRVGPHHSTSSFFTGPQRGLQLVPCLPNSAGTDFWFMSPSKLQDIQVNVSQEF